MELNILLNRDFICHVIEEFEWKGNFFQVIVSFWGDFKINLYMPNLEKIATMVENQQWH